MWWWWSSWTLCANGHNKHRYDRNVGVLGGTRRLDEGQRRHQAIGVNERLRLTINWYLDWTWYSCCAGIYWLECRSWTDIKRNDKEWSLAIILRHKIGPNFDSAAPVKEVEREEDWFVRDWWRSRWLRWGRRIRWQWDVLGFYSIWGFKSKLETKHRTKENRSLSNNGCNHW